MSVRRYLQEILLILHLTGEGNSLPPVWQYLKCVCYSCYCCQLCVLVVVCALPACVTGMTGRCSLFGRDHIHTFDGVLYQFPGDCSYLLAGDCNHHSFSLLGEMVWLLLWFVLYRYVCKSIFPLHVFALLSWPCVSKLFEKSSFCSSTGDFVNGRRTGVTLFLGDAFELQLSVDGQLSQGETRFEGEKMNHVLV